MSHNQASASVVLFHDATYPLAYPPALLDQLLGEVFATFHVQIVGADELAARLDTPCSLFVSLHGAYFPKQAWSTIERYLTRGGNVAIFGGMPFTHPVLPDGTIEPEQQTYTDRLYLGPFFQLDLPAAQLSLSAAREATFIEEDNFLLLPEQRGTFWSFYPKCTQISDHPEETGSSGPLDTVITPLLFAYSATITEKYFPLATPVVMLDQQHGLFKGGRWLLSPWQPAEEHDWSKHTALLHQLLSLALEACLVLDVHPLLACYQPGESPTLVISAQTEAVLSTQIMVSTPAGDKLATFERTLKAAPVRQELRIQLPPQTISGLYKVDVYYQQTVALHQETGFWIWNPTLVAQTAGKRLTAGRDYFYQGEHPFLLFGTTYMDSRVQRKFLSLPNAARWDTDFAKMSRSGVNVVRTGIWSGWRDIMPIVGLADEVTLRALDAFVLTACVYNIHIIFTFFTFYPPLFEGVNPWLDPRSLEGQQEFIAAIVRRYADVGLVSWDLINEPSFGNPKAIFSQRPLPNYDHFELKAYQSWLAAHYTTIEELQLRWRKAPSELAAWEEVKLPLLADYDTYIRSNTPREILQVMDYTHFSQDMFSVWADKMRRTIHAAGSSSLVGVGQDEAGVRISPQFYAQAVDYTTTHPWWNNDDLLWDMLMDKTLETPNIIQEIGVMLTRDVDMRPWRSEQECADLLERKLITGLIARGAGLIQWLWHLNAGMTSDNENSIGLVRPDGSIKPELLTMLEIGRLARELGPHMVETITPPDVWLIAPYTQWFQRPDPAIAATRQAIRVLGYDLGIVPQVINEYRLIEINLQAYHPRYILLPAVQVLSQAAWQAILGFVDAGTTLLVSGALSHDQHNLATRFQLTDEAETYQTVPVSRFERLQQFAGVSSQLVFDKDKIGHIRKAHNQLKSYHRGAGKIIWSGLPLELSENPQATRQVYRHVLQASVQEGHEDSSLLVVKRPLIDGEVTFFVSESSENRQVDLDQQVTVTVAANRAGAVLVKHSGERLCFGGVQ